MPEINIQPLWVSTWGSTPNQWRHNRRNVQPIAQRCAHALPAYPAFLDGVGFDLSSVEWSEFTWKCHELAEYYPCHISKNLLLMFHSLSGSIPDMSWRCKVQATPLHPSHHPRPAVVTLLLEHLAHFPKVPWLRRGTQERRDPHLRTKNSSHSSLEWFQVGFW